MLIRAQKLWNGENKCPLDVGSRALRETKCATEAEIYAQQANSFLSAHAVRSPDRSIQICISWIIKILVRDYLRYGWLICWADATVCLCVKVFLFIQLFSFNFKYVQVILLIHLFIHKFVVQFNFCLAYWKPMNIFVWIVNVFAWSKTLQECFAHEF